MSWVVNGLKLLKEKLGMPVCLSCGDNANMVELLWNDTTKKDERYCPRCAHSYRVEHPDCRPHGKIFDFRPAAERQPAPKNKCDMCGNDTLNTIRSATNQLLCHFCTIEITKIAGGGATMIGGRNGIVPIRPQPNSNPLEVINRKWCWKGRHMVEPHTGRLIPGQRYEFWCYECIEREEGSLTNWHIRLKINGSPEALAFFHWMMHKLDHDWEGGGDFAATEFCENCGGWEWHNPRMKPEHLKKLAKMAGLRKLKVIFWGKSEACDAKLMARRAARVPTMLEGMVE